MCTKNTATILRQRGGGTYVVKKSETSLPSRGFPSLLEEEEEEDKKTISLPPYSATQLLLFSLAAI